MAKFKGGLLRIFEFRGATIFGRRTKKISKPLARTRSNSIPETHNMNGKNLNDLQPLVVEKKMLRFYFSFFYKPNSNSELFLVNIHMINASHYAHWRPSLPFTVGVWGLIHKLYDVAIYSWYVLLYIYICFSLNVPLLGTWV